MTWAVQGHRHFYITPSFPHLESWLREVQDPNVRAKADTEEPEQQHLANGYSGFTHEILEAILAVAASAPALEAFPWTQGLHHQHTRGCPLGKQEEAAAPRQ